MTLTASTLVIGVKILCAEEPRTPKIVLENNQYHFSEPVAFEKIARDGDVAPDSNRINVWLQIGVAGKRPIFVTIDTPVVKAGEVPKLMQRGEIEWKALLSSSPLVSPQIVHCPDGLVCCETDSKNNCVKYKCACP